MKAYIWLSVLILSVFTALVFFSRSQAEQPPTAHEESEAIHAGCDHEHAAQSAPPPQHEIDAVSTVHKEEEHPDCAELAKSERKGASGRGHSGHEHEVHAAPHTECAVDEEAQDPHADHAHAGGVNHGVTQARDPHAGHAHAEAEDGMCPEHQVPEAEDALCLSDHIAELRPGAGMLVRLASEEVGARAGIRTTTPQAAQLTEPLQVPARLTFARERLATITPLASGIVDKLHVRPGTRVEKSDLLLEIATPEIARLHAGYSAAVAELERNNAALEREKKLYERGISAEEEVQRARAAWRASRSEVEQYRCELRSFNLDAEHMSGSTLVPVRAPFAGVVTRLETSRGEGVSASSSLLTLADPDILWLELSIPALHAPSVVPHTPVQVTFNGVDSAPLETELFHVDPALNPQSRTLRALAQIPNPEGRLKAGMFTNAILLRSGSSAGVSLPADAVQHIDGHSYIFIQHEPDLFELRRVTTSALQEGRVGISAGIDPAHGSELRVVSARGFALKSEVLRARLGASCADH